MVRRADPIDIPSVPANSSIEDLIDCLKSLHTQQAVRLYFKDGEVKMIEFNSESKKEFKDRLYNNQINGNAILISEPKHLKRLYEVIILKKSLLNGLK